MREEDDGGAAGLMDSEKSSATRLRGNYAVMCLLLEATALFICILG